ncbi:hypothetical protein PJI17_21440 [Mycobacterium kansasii]
MTDRRHFHRGAALGPWRPGCGRSPRLRARRRRAESDLLGAEAIAPAVCRTPLSTPTSICSTSPLILIVLAGHDLAKQFVDVVV